MKLSSPAGKPLDLTAGKWLGATGHVTITPEQKGGAEIVATFEGLVPGGTYSLFENHHSIVDRSYRFSGPDVEQRGERLLRR